MIAYIIRNKENLFLLIIEVILFILGLLSLIDDSLFLITKREASANIIKVEKLKLPNPYRITLSYYNEFEHKDIITHIDDIDGIYGQTLPTTGESLSVYYKPYFPKAVYIIDYKHPNIGYLIIYCVFLAIMFLAAYFSWKKLLPIHSIL